MSIFSKKMFNSLLAVACFALPMLSNAGELERKAANEMLDVLQYEKQLNETIEMCINMVKGSLNDVDNQFAENQETVLRKFFNECMSIDKMRGDMIEIYSDVFTADEINDMISFYKTKTGQKFLEKTPEITQRSMQLTQFRLTQNMDKMYQILDEEAAKHKSCELSND